MPLPIPVLDDRHFQDIVDEARKRIPHYVKEWTDHNVSDPGITMIELFAWMTDMILYRLNRVPDLHTIKFMDMMGVTLSEPVPARVPVTFRLSAPQETAVVIPKDTEVASTQTETEPSIVFSTDGDFEIDVPQLAAVFTRVTDRQSGQLKFTPKQKLDSLQRGMDGFPAFSAQPRPGDALYFGFNNDLSHHILGLALDVAPARGAGVNPNLPPYIWEASTGDEDSRWETCEVDMDTTKGLNAAGRIRIYLPQMGRRRMTRSGEDLFWVRCKVKEITTTDRDSGMSPYKESPQIRRVHVTAWGGTTATTHAQRIEQEFLGQSDGSAGQRYFLQVTPILERRAGETLIVMENGKDPQEWTEVRDFADSDGSNQHFTLDSATGELRLGPAIRQPNGTVRLYGAIPARGANLIFQRYRYGGGQEGNVQAFVLNTLKTAIPYIDRVQNRVDARGGLDQETVEAAMMRMPSLLRSRDRAVTESDFEFLAQQALPAVIGRVRCLQPLPSSAGRVVPGRVHVLVIPRVPEPKQFIRPELLELADDAKARLLAYLDQRRLLTTRVEIPDPAFRWVAARVQLRAADNVARTDVEADVLARLYHYLNPLVGGPDGRGWPFGRELFLSDVYQCLQGLPGVQFIRNVDLYLSTAGGGPQGDPVESVELLRHGVIVSGRHEVEFI